MELFWGGAEPYRGRRGGIGKGRAVLGRSGIMLRRGRLGLLLGSEYSVLGDWQAKPRALSWCCLGQCRVDVKRDREAESWY